MSTIYTFNNKVLKNSSNDKWLIKKEAPAAYKFDLNNATYISSDNKSAVFPSPTFPELYNGDGHKLKITVDYDIATCSYLNILYTSSSESTSGPQATNMITSAEMGNLGKGSIWLQGTYEMNMNANAYTSQGMGLYLALLLGGTPGYDTTYPVSYIDDDLTKLFNHVTIEII